MSGGALPATIPQSLACGAVGLSAINLHGSSGASRRDPVVDFELVDELVKVGQQVRRLAISIMSILDDHLRSDLEILLAQCKVVVSDRQLAERSHTAVI